MVFLFRYSAKKFSWQKSYCTCQINAVILERLFNRIDANIAQAW